MSTHPLEESLKSENPETKTLFEKEEMKCEVPFKYDFVDKELVTYMKELMSLYITENAELNIDNKTFLVEHI